MTNLWIEGGSCSGKSQRVCEQFYLWAETEFSRQPNPQAASQSVLVLSVDADRRQALSDRLNLATGGEYPVTAATPISFCRDRVLLFWPLLVRLLDLKAQFPILLRVENEQELATELWRDLIEQGFLRLEGVSRERLVRRMLDLFLLAANSGRRIEEIPEILRQGIETGAGEESDRNFYDTWQRIGAALCDWRAFCWQHGLLTYGTIAELFGRYLLPHPQFQAKFKQQFRYIIADDVDEFPAIARDLCQVLMEGGAKAIFTFNPQGSARLGLGADPNYWVELARECEIVALPGVRGTLGEQTTDLVLELTLDPEVGRGWQYMRTEPIAGFVAVETISRAKLLRSVADIIADAIRSERIKASEVAIIAPGLDDIANYALMEILGKKGISILPLHDQRPLSVSTQVRSLLTLMALVYPDLGHLISRDEVAEMLVTLSAKPDGEAIDPVRAGILADHCFAPHPSQPRLLKSDTYSQWNRLGYEVSQAYEQLRQWIEQQPHAIAPLLLLDRAVQKFLVPVNLSFERMVTLQELIETAQHYWQVSYRLGRQNQNIIERFITLIRQGTVTANPYAPHTPTDSIALATIYQYRMARGHHRWQFWLDAGSPLWKQGGAAALFGAPLFLHDWSGEPQTIQSEETADRQRLQRLLRDLLDRADERVYLCYSELSTSGQIQVGPLSALVDIAFSESLFENRKG